MAKPFKPPSFTVYPSLDHDTTKEWKWLLETTNTKNWHTLIQRCIWLASWMYRNRDKLPQQEIADWLKYRGKTPEELDKTF